MEQRAAVLLPPGHVLSDSFPPVETTSVHEEEESRGAKSGPTVPEYLFTAG